MVAYHYCSMESFFSIISNRSLFLSDPTVMNDAEEIHWYIRLLEKTREEIKNLNKMSTSDLQKLEMHLGYDTGNILDAIESAITGINTILVSGQDKIMIACFCKEKDKLSQWWRYGDDGNGIAIGFYLDELDGSDCRLSSKFDPLSR